MLLSRPSARFSGEWYEVVADAAVQIFKPQALPPPPPPPPPFLSTPGGIAIAVGGGVVALVGVALLLGRK